jgi:hypothetical protein
VAFCGFLWRFVAFCGFLAIWIVPGKLKFFVKSFGRDHLIVSNGKTGKCHFVAGALLPTLSICLPTLRLHLTLATYAHFFPRRKIIFIAVVIWGEMKKRD